MCVKRNKLIDTTTHELPCSTCGKVEKVKLHIDSTFAEAMMQTDWLLVEDDSDYPGFVLYCPECVEKNDGGPC